MLDCFTYCQKDSALALANLRWIAEMGCVETHDILLVVPEGVDLREHLAAAQSAFAHAEVYVIDDVTSGWPFGANHAFKRAVDYIDHKKLGRFLYHECDAIPITPQWLNRIAADAEAAYREQKPFMGFLEYALDPERRHMNGAGVYIDVHTHAPSLLMSPTPSDPSQIGANHMAFDWGGKDEVVPKMRVSKLFQFQYRKEDELLQDETLSWLRPDAVIFHTCKNQRIFDLLRARNKRVEFPRKQASIAGDAGGLIAANAGSSPAPAAITCDIFIKTYPKVAQWHECAMRSIDKFCTGFRRTVVVGEQPVEGYQQMQVVKLTADLRTDADFILFTDSDCIFSLPVTPDTYLLDSKPIWLHRSWEQARIDEGQEGMDKWERGMRKFFGVQPPREFMCRHPEMIPSWLLAAFRMFCQTRHGMTMEQWVLKDEEFADWNILGMYAWLYHRECFHWIDQDAGTPPPMTLKQFWGGHADFEKHREEIDRIISGGVDVVHVGNERHLAPPQIQPGPPRSSALLPAPPSIGVVSPGDGWSPIGEAPKPKMNLMSAVVSSANAPKPPEVAAVKKKPRKRKKKRTPEAQARINERMAKVRAARKAAA